MSQLKSLNRRSTEFYLIAEIGANHQGDLDLAKQCIISAKKNGAHAVKFQKRNLATLFTQKLAQSPSFGANSFGSTYQSHREHLELTNENFYELKALAHDLELDFIVTPFDIPSLKFLDSLDVDAIKIGSADLTNTPLVSAALRLSKPVLISTGASSMDELEQLQKLILQIAPQPWPVILHCVSSYPCPDENINLPFLKELRKLFSQCPIGYSGHEQGILASIAARALGAVVIERHFTLDKDLKGTDQSFSLNPNELKQLSDQLQQLDAMMKPHPKQIHPFEKSARHKLGKSIYSSKSLPKGSLITENELCLKSPAEGLSAQHLPHIIGRRLTKDIGPEHLISFEDLDQPV